MSKRLRAATLAVGTEITDGQVVDRNSAWISQRLIADGIEITEHRSVPDERDSIREALRNLGSKNELLFVTGGLGPTSDDFTRELVAEVFARPLDFDEASWSHVNERLKSRGVPVRESQRQQCYFPTGAEVLPNPAGTANGFVLKSGDTEIFVLPGPPVEIAAIWEKSLATRFQSLVPPEVREKLHIWRCLGRGESEFADLTEKQLSGLGLRLGYRAHVPYVEIKVWVPVGEANRFETPLKELESQLLPWLINRDEEDLAEDVLRWLEKGGRLEIFDAATQGLFSDRFNQRIRETKRSSESTLDLVIHQEFSEPAAPESWASHQSGNREAGGVTLALASDAARKVFYVSIEKDGKAVRHEIPSQFGLTPRAERSRRFIVEKSLHLLAAAVSS